MKWDRVQWDIKRNCTFHKYIGHITARYMSLRDEIKRLIRAGHFKEFVDELQTMNREERPQQRSPERFHKVLTIIGGLHLSRESHNA